MTMGLLQQMQCTQHTLIPMHHGHQHQQIVISIPGEIHNTAISTQSVTYNVTIDRASDNVTTETVSCNISVTNTSCTNNVTEPPVDYDLLREIDYYKNLARRIWKIWSPVLLGKTAFSLVKSCWITSFS